MLARMGTLTCTEKDDRASSDVADFDSYHETSTVLVQRPRHCHTESHSNRGDRTEDVRPKKGRRSAIRVVVQKC
ncbi:hypothetical protein M404DRAFT_1007248 [Pisolithus tinctorius Marx 270]|uniref:Uncharacterized protein n=1 Tax=Pisolithus tinctorius Marx 270 TaxID=870435 RepID=A0A0C3IFE1_PISTI|nr:hypothetical protein M404DRAFT_1007248 [Pisolithus tinctorius Marx 270]